jgi:hypothetical protein
VPEILPCRGRFRQTGRVRVVGWVLGAVAALAASVGVHFLLGGFLLVTTCGVSDTGSEHPAEASWQGWVCGAGADSVWQVPGAWVLLASALVATGLALSAARRGPGVVRRVLGVVAALVVLPVLTAVLLALPPDTCTDAQRATTRRTPATPGPTADPAADSAQRSRAASSPEVSRREPT